MTERTDFSSTATSNTKTYRVLHVLDHSTPLLSGYSIRSKNIVETQQKLGHRVQVVTGPAHQLDDPEANDTLLNGISYFRTRLNTDLRCRAVVHRWPLLRELAVVSLIKKRILSLLDASPVDIIHAHSPSIVGLAARSAAGSRRLPFVYEVRGFWEESAVDQNKISRRSLRYHLSRQLEEFVIRRADYVVCIARNIFEDLAARGIGADKMVVIPNGVDANRFRPTPRDEQLAATLGLRDGLPVLGYIGSLWRFEGIPWLIRGAAGLRQRGIKFRLLIIGHGEETAAVHAAIRDCGAEEFIIFSGQIPHDEICRYYSVMDVLVYPRRRARVTEKVTPLKPLEAMAHAKAILGSNVGGIRELVTTEETGLLFDPDDIEDFSRQAARLLTDAQLRHKLGEAGRQAVLREKDWKLLARRYELVYAKAMRHHEKTAPDLLSPTYPDPL